MLIGNVVLPKAQGTLRQEEQDEEVWHVGEMDEEETATEKESEEGSSTNNSPLVPRKRIILDDSLDILKKQRGKKRRKKYKHYQKETVASESDSDNEVSNQSDMMATSINFFVKNRIFHKVKFFNSQMDQDDIQRGSVGRAVCKNFNIEESGHHEFWDVWKEHVGQKLNALRNAVSNYMKKAFFGKYRK